VRGAPAPALPPPAASPPPPPPPLPLPQASPPTRTPPLVQTVLLNAGVLFAVPLSKLFLGDNKVYCSFKPLVAGVLIITSVTVSLLPSIISGTQPEVPGRRVLLAGGGDGGAAPPHALGGSVDDTSGLNPFLWSLVYLFSNLPWAADCIVEQVRVPPRGCRAPPPPRRSRRGYIF